MRRLVFHSLKGYDNDNDNGSDDSNHDGDNEGNYDVCDDEYD